MKYKEAGNGWYCTVNEDGTKNQSWSQKNKPGFYAQMMKWVKEGNEIEPQFTVEELAVIEAEKQAQIIPNFISLVQAYLDEKAQEKGYDNIFTAVTYADELSVEKFQTEGEAFRVWRSLVWEKCYQILSEVEAGSRVQPAIEELISELPLLTL